MAYVLDPIVADKVITYDETEKRVLECLQHSEDFAYWYGAKFEVLTKEIMDKYWSAYYKAFWCKYADMKEEIYRWSIGKIGIDCSGLVGRAVNQPWDYSGKLIEDCKVITTPRDGVEGSILWHPGHVALDIGKGFYIHTPRPMTGVVLGRIKDNPNFFVKSGQAKYVDYTGASNK